MDRAIPPFFLLLHFGREQVRDLGGDRLQKLCFLAQAAGVPVAARFYLYHSGPYSPEVNRDLLSWLAAGYVEEHGEAPDRTFVTSRAGLAQLAKLEKLVLDKHLSRLRRVVHEFGDRPREELELLATALMVDRDLLTAFGSRRPVETVAALVHRANPDSTPERIKEAVLTVQASPCFAAPRGRLLHATQVV